ncbi:AbgT family transporter [Salinicola halimionae]|uniref:AbgT family transporter n=1 Tax=Salinicola halimionae TaxID=1949081 RepID=UPI000DA1E85E|nr:AbgT family transporter [Salinicola halimionae]
MEATASRDTARPRLSIRLLNAIERFGNRLPDPFMIFVMLAMVVLVASALFAAAGATVEHPGSGEVEAIRSLVSGEGIQFILDSMLDNFTGFAPLGLVLSMMLGIGLAEKLGLLETLIRHTILSAPKRLVTYTVAFTGIMMNVASDASLILLPPLAAMVYHSLGRHPIAGLALGFASAGAGFTANLLIVGTDALLSGISTEAARIVSSDMTVTPVDNWYFNCVSVFVLTVVAAVVTERVIEPRLGTYEGDVEQVESREPENAGRGLRNTGIAALIYVAAIATLLFWPNSPLRGPEGGLIPSPFLSGIIPIILFFFITVSVTWGITVGRIKRSRDVSENMAEAMRDLGSYIVLIFAASQFIAWFNWSHIGTWIAVNGADLLTAMDFTGFPVILCYIVFTACMNLLIFSGSAKWALEAPVFVPMFMQLGYHPAFVQVAYRIADSSTNIISPLNPYMIVVLTFIRKYDKNAGLGTLMSLMLPYTLAFLSIWILLLTAFYLLGLPYGPGITTYLPS